MAEERYYNNLIAHKESISDLLSKPESFQRIPRDWHVIITDIQNSTVTVERGLFEVVNLVATGSIIAALNIAAKTEIDIPFFFGGDGATLLVPSTLVKEIMNALIIHQSNVKRQYNIDLRVGSMPVNSVYEFGFELKIAKVSVNKLHAIPLVLGNGLHYVEDVIKSKDIVRAKENLNSTELNLEGMMCRWNRIPPPPGDDEVVCFLIDAVEESDQAVLFAEILNWADKIYGTHAARNPISLAKLKENAGYKNIMSELKIRKPKFNFLDAIKEWILTLKIKYFYLPSKNGQSYLNELVQLSDIFVLDGRINMVISGKTEQRKKLLSHLDGLESAGKIIYGFHVSTESVISCYVRNTEEYHIHFINGGNGGFTKAAKILKAKIKQKGK